jgi:hypothetical protein
MGRNPLQHDAKKTQRFRCASDLAPRSANIRLIRLIRLIGLIRLIDPDSDSDPDERQITSGHLNLYPETTKNKDTTTGDWRSREVQHCCRLRSSC